MGRYRNMVLGIIGSSVLAVLGITSCSRKAINNEEIIDVYGPPPSEFVDSLDNAGEEPLTDTDSEQTSKETK